MNKFCSSFLDLSRQNTYLRNRIENIDVDHGIVFSFESNTQLCDMTIDCVESRLLLVGSQDGHIHIFDVEDPRVWSLDSIKHTSIASICNRRSGGSGFMSKGSPLVCMQWYPVDSGSFISASANKILGIWDTNRLEVCLTFYSISIILRLSDIARVYRMFTRCTNFYQRKISACQNSLLALLCLQLLSEYKLLTSITSEGPGHHNSDYALTSRIDFQIISSSLILSFLFKSFVEILIIYYLLSS
ncbi:unnamed protein product [Schistosoma turkestanicum]|nr:unnamed protein product [Schistosoma turkestanicum]